MHDQMQLLQRSAALVHEARMRRIALLHALHVQQDLMVGEDGRLRLDHL